MDPTSRLKSIYNILRGIQEDATMEDEFPPVFYSITPEVMKELSELAFMKEKGSTTSEDLTNLLLHDVTKTLERTTVDGKKKANTAIPDNIHNNIQNMLGIGKIRCGFCGTMSDSLVEFAGDNICNLCHNMVSCTNDNRSNLKSMKDLC
jgi:hypothetical protein